MINCQCQPFQVCDLCRVDLSKPGPKKKKDQKTKQIKNHNIEKPEKLHCRRCDRTTGSEELRHLETFRKHEFGKGTGQKCNDKATALLCDECDHTMSNLRPQKYSTLYWQHAEEWLYLILKTWLI